MALALAVAIPPLSPALAATAGSGLSPAHAPNASGSRSRVFTNAETADRIPGEWVIAVDRGSLGGARSAVARAGGRVLRTSATGDRLLVSGVEDSDALWATLEGVPGVRYSEPNGKVRAMTLPGDPLYPQQWGLQRIDAPAAWDHTWGSASVSIAVVDTGVDYTHPEFSGRVDLENDKDFVNGDADAMDDGGHGTNVAGIAAAGLDGSGMVGMAPGCRILPLKVLDAVGSGDTWDLADGIRWAADRGADVVNMSVGVSFYSQDVADAVRYALAKDCVLVAPTGNSGAFGVVFPAALPGVIGVSAVDSLDVWAHFSNHGDEVDIAAPGSSILTTARGGGTMNNNGTSMATPFVSGAAALLRSQSPTLSYSQVTQRLLDTSVDLGQTGKDDYYGYGRLDVGAALAVASVPSDDDIPGVLPPAPPVKGSLDAEDTHDVYRLSLASGQRVAVSLVASAGTDFELRLFGPDAANVDFGTPRATSDSGYPAQLVHTADVTGDYCLDVRRRSGTGGYQVGYAVSAPGSDDRIPGVPLVGSFPSIVLDALGEDDSDDVFSFHADVDETVSLRLDAAGGTDFRLYLFGPDATDLNNDPYLGKALETGYPQTIEVRAPAEGTYFANVYDHGAGSAPGGVYELTCDVRLQGTIPTNVQLTVSDPSPIQGATVVLTAAVKEVSSGYPIPEGEVVFESWSGVEWLEVTRLQTDDQGIVTAGAIASTPGYYRARFSGVESLGFSPSTSAGVRIRPRAPTALALTPSTYAPAYAAAASLVARLTAAGGSTQVDGRTVLLERYANGSWVRVTQAIAVGGRVTFTVRPSRTTAYRTRFAGDAEYGPSASPGRIIRPRVYLPAPWAPGTARRGVSLTSAGFLKPRHSVGARSVQVRCYRYERGRWVFRKAVWARNANYSTYTRYSARLALPYAGRWKLRAYHPQDALRGATWSGWSREIRVY